MVLLIAKIKGKEKGQLRFSREGDLELNIDPFLKLNSALACLSLVVLLKIDGTSCRHITSLILPTYAKAATYLNFYLSKIHNFHDFYF